MQTTTLSQLKTSLHTYLRRVKAGEEVIITERGRPIARLSPIAHPVSSPEYLKAKKKDPQARGKALARGFLGPAASRRPPSNRALGCLEGQRGRPVKFWDTSAIVPLCVQEPTITTCSKTKSVSYLSRRFLFCHLPHSIKRLSLCILGARTRWLFRHFLRGSDTT